MQTSVTSFRPQQGLTIMNLNKEDVKKKVTDQFPSPTGVNYYEFERILKIVYIILP